MRLKAQDILLRNLRADLVRSRRRWWRRTPQRAIPKWPGIKLDLSEALLLDFDLSWCQLDDANFTRAQFTGRANFGSAQFTGSTRFVGAQFTGGANFGFAEFTEAMFMGDQFTRVTPPLWIFWRRPASTLISFRGARVVSADTFRSVWPPDWTTRPAKPANVEDSTFLYLIKRGMLDPQIRDLAPGPSEPTYHPG